MMGSAVEGFVEVLSVSPGGKLLLMERFFVRMVLDRCALNNLFYAMPWNIDVGSRGSGANLPCWASLKKFCTWRSMIWIPWFTRCSSSLTEVGIYTFCFVRQHMLSLSIPLYCQIS